MTRNAQIKKGKRKDDFVIDGWMEIVEFSFTLSCFCSHSFTRSLCYTRIYLACKKFWFMGFHVNDVLWRIRQTLKQNIFVENIMFGLYLIGFSFIFSSPPSLLNCCCCVSVFFLLFLCYFTRAHNCDPLYGIFGAWKPNGL